jgi:Family of unknown function (DUF6176)
MPTYGLVFPILPGKESLAHEVPAHLKEHRPEYEESRRGAGISVERAYLQVNPDGSRHVVVYVEAASSMRDSMQTLLSSSNPVDRYFFEKNGEATGVDFYNGPTGPEPELVGQWLAPGASSRGRGFAFAAPLKPAMTQAGRLFAQEAFVARRSEITESRLAKNVLREEVFLNQTPMGDIIVVYLEGQDPVEANRQFAASSAPFDRWFKDQCREIFLEGIDFDRPVPQNEELFSWVKST